MAVRSKKIDLNSVANRPLVNPETVQLLKKYQVDMAIRELSINTQASYVSDLYQWFSYI